MQFSTGRSELNPYIAVILGLLALAVYVAASTTTVPKLIAGTETMMRRMDGQQTSRLPVPSTGVAPGSTAPPTSMSAQLPASRSLQAPTATVRPASSFVPRPPGSTLGSLATPPPISSVGPTVTRQFGGAELDSGVTSTPVKPVFPSADEPYQSDSLSDPEPPSTQIQPETPQRSVYAPRSPASAPATLAVTTAATGAALSTAASTATADLGSSVVWTVISILIGIVVFFGLLALLARLGGVDISAAIQRGLSTQRPLYDVTISQDAPPAPAAPARPEPQEASEVFQVGNGNLTYIQARGACEAQGARLANYSQIEDAYKNGGEWCSYGWSEGQLALFPTQKETYERLQEGCSGDQNACGRPGINGGYIANPNVRFAANCYGVKPRPTKEEERAVRNKIVTPQDSEANRIAQLYKSADKQFKIRPFAPGEWSEDVSGPTMPKSA